MNLKQVALLLLAAVPLSIQYEIRIHAITHTHLDAGWLQTMEEYYDQYVNNIFATLLPELEANPHYRFNWAEVGFLYMWWNRATPHERDVLTGIVNRGQIQFVGGGWVQSDEATVEYQNKIENLKAGWDFLQKTFGVRPHVGWQLDPFGYSAYTPSILESYGFDTLFITRVGSQVKENLRENGHLRFIWKGHDSEQGIFVTTNQGDLYTVTHSLQYDVLTPNNKTNCTLDDILAESMDCLKLFILDIVSHHMATADLHNADNKEQVFHIPALFGDDFAYTNASHNFKYINKLAEMLEKYSETDYDVKITMKYSTVDEYLDSLYTSQPDAKYPVYQGDFYPYLEDVECEVAEKCQKGKRVDHWNGYYSTRSLFKAEVRQLLNKARNSKKMYGAYQLQKVAKHQGFQELEANYTLASQLSSVLMHHDAITGTHSLKTKRDYELRVEQANELLDITNYNLLKAVNDIQVFAKGYTQTKLQQLAKSILAQAQTDVTLKIIRIFNPQTTTIDGKILKTKASRTKTPILFNSEKETLVYQRLTVYQWDTPSTTIKEDIFDQELYFFLDKQQPLSFTTLLLAEFNDLKICQSTFASLGMDYAECTDRSHEFTSDNQVPEQHAFLENHDVRVTLRQSDGTIQTVHQKYEDIKVEMRQRFLAYDGKIQTSSGLYIFNPQHDAQEFKYDMKFVRAVVQEGELMKCVLTFHQVNKYRDLLFMNRICIENAGETSMFYKQQVRAHSSAYNEIVLRTEIESISYQGVVNKEMTIDYYTDDSMKAIKRKIYKDTEAESLNMDHGDDKSMLGLNGYPCNKGLIINMNGTQQTQYSDISSISFGMALSHPLLCHFLGGLKVNETYPLNTFEFLLTRSLHNNDNKGLGSIRNVESTLSQLEIIGNINRIGNIQQHSNFKHGYHLGKESVSKEEIMFTNDVSKESLDSFYLADITTMEDDIADSREAEFIGSTFKEIKGRKCMVMTMKNLMSYPVEIDSERTDNPESRRYDISKYSLPRNQLRYQVSNETILEGIKPKYETYDSLFKVDPFSTCPHDLCLKPYEMAEIAMCLRPELSLERQRALNQQRQEDLKKKEQQQIDEEQARRRRRIAKRQQPLEGDTSTHFCMSYFTIGSSIGALVLSTGFLVFAIMKKPE